MTPYTKLNFKRDVEDMAPKFGYSPGLESRFARKPLALEKSGLGYYKIAPDFDTPFGHTHSEQEEVYVVLNGSARAKVGDKIVEMKQWDAIRVAPGAWRSLAGGPDGAELLALGAPNTENKDIEMSQDFW